LKRVAAGHEAPGGSNLKSLLKPVLLPALAGALYALAFPFFDLWPLAWVFAVPLLFSVDGAGPGRAFLSGMISGLVAWAGVLYWIALVMSTYGGMSLFTAILLLLVLLAYLALYFGAFAWAASGLLKKRTAFLILPGIWAALELMRSYTIFSGFPWALLGHSQLPFTAFVQVAELGGVFLVGAVVMTGNVAIYQAMKKQYAPVAIAAGLVVLCAGFGWWRISNGHFEGTPFKVAAAQANVPQDQKWRKEQVDATLETYLSLTRQAIDQKARLVVWPETACTFYLFRSWPETMRVLRLSMSHQTDLLVGSPAYEDGRFFNRAYLLHRGRIMGTYDKIHLVPFGEYLPFAGLLREYFDGLTSEVGDFSTGTKVEPIEDIGVFICFESIFPDISRQLCKKGARVLVNMSNDAWFKTWSTPEQHLQFVCFRAIETRRWVVRAVNHGISAVIDSEGRVVERLGLLKEGMIACDIKKIDYLSFYVLYGPVLALIWAVASIIAALTMRYADAKAKVP
jgi:apolipoprotein N-acyltransferase